MGSIVLKTHWERVVLSTVREYFRFEEQLAASAKDADAQHVYETGYETLRTAMCASILLHHFTDVAVERGAMTSMGIANLGQARKLLADSTKTADGSARPNDSKILGEVADAVKHAELTAKHIVHVEKRGRVLAISECVEIENTELNIDFGVKVIVPTQGVARSLRSIIENVVRGWTSILDLQPL
ncbi:hypothetical protein [Rhizobium sp. 007]|uniref:hypothetical protein n=1 Tax=Rhizobium sp. 007 TaxID=2785056 RepID=UPI00188EF60C|nr:hypothetical protein [Rhizobium sp. 007]QPB20204.1 hypothetical protein ISN39_01380 [Rhizobium sp. 007]